MIKFNQEYGADRYIFQGRPDGAVGFLENLILLQRTVNKELKKVKMWLDINKLSLNIDKTNLIILKSPRHSSSEIINIKIGNLPVKETCYVNFLGALLDENLSWKYHLTELSKKLARTCAMFFKVRHFFYLLMF